MMFLGRVTATFDRLKLDEKVWEVTINASDDEVRSIEDGNRCLINRGEGKEMAHPALFDDIVLFLKNGKQELI